MICLSFNSSEVGGAPKPLALKRLIRVFAPDIILIQKTKCLGSKEVEFFFPWLKDWSYISLDMG
jgi:hypothetical protein